MSYTHIHLPELNILQKMLLESPEQIKYYAKYGGLIGPSDSVEFLNKKLDEYYKS